MDDDKTWCMRWVVDNNKLITFGSGPDADPAYQWDTKCKLFSPA